MEKMGIFCDMYGESIRNRVLEYLLENRELDIAVGDMAKEIGISRPKAYEVIKEFEKKKFIIKSRIVGKTQLYMLHKENDVVKLHIKNFKECLKLVAAEYGEKKELLVKVR